MKPKTRKSVTVSPTSNSCPYKFRPRQFHPKKTAVDQPRKKIKHDEKELKTKKAMTNLHKTTIKTLDEINRIGRTLPTPAGSIEHQLTDSITGHFTELGTFIMKHEELPIPKQRDTPYVLLKELDLIKRNFGDKCENLKDLQEWISVMYDVEQEIKKQEELLVQKCDLLIDCVKLQRQFFKIPETEVPQEIKDLIEKYFST